MLNAHRALALEGCPGGSATSGACCVDCRWMYFFAVWPALWMTVGYVTDKLFAFIEWWFYREALFYLDSVRRTARGLIFMCMVSMPDDKHA